MAQLTGFDDDEETTVINLTVKKGMKEGIYGNAFGGAGNKEKYETQGMLNYMRNTTKISVFGGVNNTNGGGASDFSSAMFGDAGDEEIKGLSFGGKNGIMESAAGGLNFLSEQSKKFKISGDVRYFTSQNDVVSDSRTDYTTITNRRKRSAYTEVARVELRLPIYRSSMIDFGVQGHIRYEDLNNSISKDNNRHTFRYGGAVHFTIYLPYDFVVQSNLDYTANSGFTKGFEQNEWFWNASIAKKALKNKARMIRLKVYDILKVRTNIVRRNGIDYI